MSNPYRPLSELKKLFVPIKQAADFVQGKSYYEAPEKPKAPPVNWNAVGGVIFGEANKTPEQIRHVASVIMNRANETGKTPDQVISQMGSNKIPQFNAYGGAQYNNYINGKLDILSKKKADLVNAIVEEMKSGTFQDTTGGALYFKHDKKGNIILDTTKPLFAKTK